MTNFDLRTDAMCSIEIARRLIADGKDPSTQINNAKACSNKLRRRRTTDAMMDEGVVNDAIVNVTRLKQRQDFVTFIKAARARGELNPAREPITIPPELYLGALTYYVTQREEDPKEFAYGCVDEDDEDNAIDLTRLICKDVGDYDVFEPEARDALSLLKDGLPKHRHAEINQHLQEANCSLQMAA